MLRGSVPYPRYRPTPSFFVTDFVCLDCSHTSATEEYRPGSSSITHPAYVPDKVKLQLVAG